MCFRSETNVTALKARGRKRGWFALSMRSQCHASRRVTDGKRRRRSRGPICNWLKKSKLGWLIPGLTRHSRGAAAPDETGEGRNQPRPEPCVRAPHQQWDRKPAESSVRVRFTKAGADANERLQIGFAESHAAAVKQTVITIEKTIGRIKRYLQLTTVMATKQRARAHTVTRMTAKVSAVRPPSCHANTAANR